MLGSLPIFQSAKKFITKEQLHPDGLPTLYDLYNDHDQRPWEVCVNKLDQLKVEFARNNKCPIRLTSNLTDVQLLKLHASSFPEYDNQLVYHHMFGVYEFKYDSKTRCLFSYSEGIYTPIKSI